MAPAKPYNETCARNHYPTIKTRVTNAAGAFEEQSCGKICLARRMECS